MSPIIGVIHMFLVFKIGVDNFRLRVRLSISELDLNPAIRLPISLRILFLWLILCVGVRRFP